MEIVRDRDLIVLVKGVTFPVRVNTALATSGWQGGQGAAWVDSTEDTFIVGPSDGRYGGFLLWGSDEEADRRLGNEKNQVLYRFATLCVGSWVVSTRTFETYTWASRQAGPLVALTYSPGDLLYFSLRGYFTKQDEWTASGDPRAPNTGIVGRVAQVPSALTKNYLTIHTAI